jgi:MFS family permease
VGKPLLYFTSVFVSLGVFLFGYDQGVMSGIITGWYFRDYFNQPSPATIGTVVAILEIGAFISSLLVGRIGDVIGRRRTILYGSAVFFVGGGLQTFANGMPMMMVGRIVAVSVSALCQRSCPFINLRSRCGNTTLFYDILANPVLTICHIASSQSRQVGLH